MSNQLITTYNIVNIMYAQINNN